METEISSGDKIGFSIPNLFRRCKLGEDDEEDYSLGRR